RVDVVEQRFLGSVRDIHAADRDGHHLGARCFVRLHHDGRRRILARAHDEPRPEGLIRNLERIHFLSPQSLLPPSPLFQLARGPRPDGRFPPPTKFTIPTESPSRITVRSKASRLSTNRLCSTATRRGSMSRCASRSVTVSGRTISNRSPLSVMV